MDFLKVLKAIRHFVKGFYESFSGILSIFWLNDDDLNIKRISPTRANALRHRQRRSTPIKQVTESKKSKAIKRLLQCLVINGVGYALIILTYEFMFTPFLNMIIDLLKVKGDYSIIFKFCYVICLILGQIFKALWVIPFFLLTKLINIFFFQDIADYVYRASRGSKRSQGTGTSFPDLVCSLSVQVLFLLGIQLLNFFPIPFVSYIMRMFLTCLLYSQYAFEYKWVNMGMNLSTRLNFMECEWPYFFGFGMPMFLLTEYSSSFFVSSCIFSTVFPFFIISGNAGSPPIGSGYFYIPVFYPAMYLINTVGVKLLGISNSRNNQTYRNPQNK